MTTLFPRSTRSMPAATLALIAALALSGCETAGQAVAQKEDHLSAAGFRVKPANTPARQAMLNRLPPHKFIRRDHGDTITYVYADPLVCDCLYVGGQRAYGKYQQFIQAQNLADEQEMTAQSYQDAQWNWGGWGPWGGGFGPGAFGPGPGW